MNFYLCITYLMIGALSGFLSSTPLGPINFWVTDHKLSNFPRSRLYFFLVAVIIVDLIYAGISITVQFEVLEERSEIKWLGIISGAFTTILGTFLLKRARADLPKIKVKHNTENWKCFVQGLILTGVNPAFLIFWLFVANQIISRLDKTLSIIEILFYLSGVLLGDLIWFTSFNWILSHFEKKTQESSLKKIRMAVGLIFILIGLFSVGSYAIK